MKYSYETQTIVAQCTPSGSGALCLLRVSGSQAFSIVENIAQIAGGKRLSEQPSHTVHYGWIVESDGAHVDQVLFIVMHSPKTFTGEHTVEITCHNNPFIIEHIIRLLIAHGARPAQEGEFSKRAVMNKKIDLVQAEAINELIHANTQHALKASLSQVEGSFSSFISSIEKNLVKALAFSEASFEFIDEEHLTFSSNIKELISDSLTSIQMLKKSFDYRQQVREGVRICIIGSVNAGKSSLFNKLLLKQRAIVTNIAGTTRDTIEAGLYRGGNFWTLIDTAGLRETHDIVEQHGIERSFNEAHKADIILLVYDASRSMSAAEREVYKTLINTYTAKIIGIKHKIDLPQELENISELIPLIAVSSEQGRGVQLLEEAIQAKIETLFTDMACPYLLNKRQYNLMIGLEEKLHTIISMLEEPIHYELVSHHITDALTHISELTGKTITEQGMDAVFKEFCVGK